MIQDHVLPSLLLFYCHLIFSQKIGFKMLQSCLQKNQKEFARKKRLLKFDSLQSSRKLKTQFKQLIFNQRDTMCKLIKLSHSQKDRVKNLQHTQLNSFIRTHMQKMITHKYGKVQILKRQLFKDKQPVKQKKEDRLLVQQIQQLQNFIDLYNVLKEEKMKNKCFRISRSQTLGNRSSFKQIWNN